MPPRDRQNGHGLRLSLTGDGMIDRARSTTFALLGSIAAVGLVLVGVALQQEWPLVGGSPLPEPPLVRDRGRLGESLAAPAGTRATHRGVVASRGAAGAAIGSAPASRRPRADGGHVTGAAPVAGAPAGAVPVPPPTTAPSPTPAPAPPPAPASSQPTSSPPATSAAGGSVPGSSSVSDDRSGGGSSSGARPAGVAAAAVGSPGHPSSGHGHGHASGHSGSSGLPRAAERVVESVTGAGGGETGSPGNAYGHGGSDSGDGGDGYPGGGHGHYGEDGGSGEGGHPGGGHSGGGWHH